METAKLLYRRLDALLGTLDPKRPPQRALESFLEDAFRTLREDLHLRAGLLYAEQRDGFAMAKTVGDPDGPVADTLDPSQAPLSLIFRHRVYIFSDPNGEGSPQRLGLLPRRAAAALVVGRRPNRHVFFFLLAEGWILEEVDFTLNTLRAALGSRLLDARAQGTFREAAEIQQSLLLEEPPDFPGFEIACRSVAAEEVGGDFFDFHVFEGDMLGLAIGDASGHGLPAALLVRDVVTGLRMGLERELKATHVFTKLNRVIHRSNLSSRFVSVFYGELEGDGNLTYVNAGHPPPLLFFQDAGKGSGYVELATGGTVIGPLPEVQFHRGFARMRPREVLVLCTDGILERHDRAGEFFGTERLKAVVAERQDRSAGEILDRLFEAAIAFGDGRPWEDDATAVVVRRQAD
jgi:serine phosphatase RsbU (regulator of sigma subunit)